MSISGLPEGFNPHKGIKRVFDGRRKAIESGEGVDWGFAEALAFGTLVSEGRLARPAFFSALFFSLLFWQDPHLDLCFTLADHTSLAHRQIIKLQVLSPICKFVHHLRPKLVYNVQISRIWLKWPFTSPHSKDVHHATADALLAQTTGRQQCAQLQAEEDAYCISIPPAPSLVF